MSDKGPDGKFLPGNQAAKGFSNRRKAVEEAEYRQVLHRVITKERFADIIERMYQHVVDTGSIRAAQFLTEQLIGKPTQRSEEAQAAMPEWLAIVLQVQAPQVNEQSNIALLNDHFIKQSADDDVVDGVIVDTTIGIESAEATKTPGLGEQSAISVATTSEKGENADVKRAKAIGDGGGGQDRTGQVQGEEQEQ